MSKDLIEELEELHNWWAEHFQSLATYLLTCDLFIKEFPQVKNFPPNRSHQEVVSELLLKGDEKRGFNSQILGKDYHNFEEAIRDGHKRLYEIKVQDRNSFLILAELCQIMWTLHKTLSSFQDLASYTPSLLETQRLGAATIGKAHEVVGYWTCKTQERKRNLKNVSVKSTKRAANKAIIKNLLSENNWKVSKGLIRKGEDLISREERTVKNLIKEIKAEHNK